MSFRSEESLTNPKKHVIQSRRRRISDKPKKNTSFRAVGEESHARPVRDLSLSLKMTEMCVIQKRRISDKPQKTRHSEPLGEESHARLVRDLSLSLKMTER